MGNSYSIYRFSYHILVIALIHRLIAKRILYNTKHWVSIEVYTYSYVYVYLPIVTGRYLTAHPT